MKILYIYRHSDLGFSIEKVFRPIEYEMKKYAEVDSVFMPIANYSLHALWENVKFVRKIVKTNRYDIIHITGTEHYLIPFLHGNKVVVTVHDLGRLFNLHSFHRWKYWLMQVLPLRYAAMVTCISEFSKSEIKKALPFSNEKIVVIPNEVGDDFQYTKKVFNLQSPIILHIGTRPHKNLSRTIKALIDIECRLRIIGKVDKRDLELLEQNRIQYEVLVNLSDEELRAEYCNADIVNFPSCHEGFGMPIIEGQALGRLVVTSNIEPMLTVAGNGAIICNPYSVESIREAYIKIITGVICVDDIMKKGLKNVEKYRLPIVAKQYFELYKSI